MSDDNGKRPMPLGADLRRPDETPEEWFRRVFGEMPAPTAEMDAPQASPERARRKEALETLECTIPGALRWAKFAAPELAQRVPPAALSGAQQAWREPRLCVMGAARAGKTSLAVAMLRRWVTETGKPAGFFHSYRLGLARIQHPAGHGEADHVAQAMRLPLALLDDLGSERDTATNALPDVIFERHAENRPTWVTTGLTREQLVKRYGQGIVARVFERAKVLRVGSKAED